MFGRKKVRTENYKNERKMMKGIDKMARKGWAVQKITSYDKGRNVFQVRNQRQLAGVFGLGKNTGLFSKRANSFIVIFERS